MTLPRMLPAADERGHYWLGKNRATCPVVFKAGEAKPKGFAPDNAAGWLASTGSEGPGVLFDGSRIAYFKTARLALEALREVAC